MLLGVNAVALLDAMDSSFKSFAIAMYVRYDSPREQAGIELEWWRFKQFDWCSGRDLNPGRRLERPSYLTGLYYRSPNNTHFSFAFPIYSNIVFVAVANIFKPGFYKFLFFFQVLGVGYMPFFAFKVYEVSVYFGVFKFLRPSIDRSDASYPCTQIEKSWMC